MINLSPLESADLLKSKKDLRIIDVRENWEYEIVHLPQSELMPLSNFQKYIVLLNVDENILVYCHHGVRSVTVCKYLISNGFKNVFNLSGGINAWADQVDQNMIRY